MNNQYIIQRLRTIRYKVNHTPLNQKLSVWEVEINWLLDKELSDDDP